MNLRRIICVVLTGFVAACGPDSASIATDVLSPTRSVLLFTIDTLRADHLSAYGYEKHSTPATDQFARQSLVFERAYSQATQTNPACTSMLTGLVPPRHGVLTQGNAVRDEVVTLAAMLSSQGFTTGTFSANLCRLQDVSGSVFQEGWTHLFCGMNDEKPQRTWGRDVVDAGMRWMAEQQSEKRPFFAWIHLMDPHGEWDPGAEQWDHAADPLRSKTDQTRHYSQFESEQVFPPAEELARLNALYDAEVRGSDALFAEVLTFIETLPDSGEIAVILSADHGEELYDSWSRLGHGASMTEGVLHVPLMVRATGVSPGRSDALVETLAITPTILDLLGADSPYSLDARSLLEGVPELPFARSYAWPPVVSLRSENERVWVRGSPEPPEPRHEVPWRVEVPWYQFIESIARYEPNAPTLPIWVAPESLSANGLGARLLDAARRVAGDMEGGTAELSEITDPAYLEQLIQLGYIEGSAH